MKKLFKPICGILTGLCNSLFGAGGGIIAVLHFKNKGAKQKNSQATALFCVFIISLLSLGYYLYKEHFSFNEAIPYIPFGIIGAVCGSILINKIPDKLLKKAFAVFIIYAGIKSLWR